MTSWWLGAGLLVLLLIVLVLYLSMTAGRIDHLHRRIDTSTLALDSHLLRRSSVAMEIATSQMLDPASSILLADAAHQARTSVDEGPETRALAESGLTSALRAVLTEEDIAVLVDTDEGADMLGELTASCRRVQLSRTFHNDAVRACRQLRSQRAVRWFRLAGHTPLPRAWEMDDTMPEALELR